MAGGGGDSSLMDAVRFVVIVGGIYLFYGVYGVYKEAITRQDYDGEKFSLTTTLVLVECVFNSLMAFGAMRANGVLIESQTPQRAFFVLAASYVLSMAASTEALQNISYPTQVLAKSCKAVPIMVMNFLRGAEHYSRQKWLAVLCIVAGVVLFTLSSKSKAGAESKWIGLLLVLVSLSLDGFTGSTQTKLKKTTNPSSHEFMFYMNIYACAYLLFLAGVRGELHHAPGFLHRHPGTLYNILGYALSSAFGQVFIFLALTTYGPVRLALITTTRKFFTLLVSFAYFGHAVSPGTVAACVLVFGGVYLEKRAPAVKSKEDKKKE